MPSRLAMEGRPNVRPRPARSCLAMAGGSLSLRARRAGQGKIHVIMPGYVIHVMALRKEIIDITKIGISDNF
jgi:hypothetical protein